MVVLFPNTVQDCMDAVSSNASAVLCRVACCSYSEAPCCILAAFWLHAQTLAQDRSLLAEMSQQGRVVDNLL